jgi:hypothetical protein
MGRVLSAALLLLAASSAPTGEGGAGFAPTLPPGIVDVSGWETVAGHVDGAQLRGGFLFYVNPSLAGIYQVMRYRVQLLAPTGDLEEHRASTERVAYVRHPGLREPLLCWAAAPPGVDPSWRTIAPGSDEYRMEMLTLIRVLALHREVPKVDQP